MGCVWTFVLRLTAQSVGGEEERQHDRLGEIYSAQHGLPKKQNARCEDQSVGRGVPRSRRESSREDVMRTEHVAFEHQFQRINLFSKCGWLYLFLGILATLSFVVMPKYLRVVALVLCISAFLLQTYGIWARIVISERRPVVSLYQPPSYRLGDGSLLYRC